MANEDKRIVIAGAGSIGCYAGGCLALAGRRVILLARPRIEEALRKDGLRATELARRMLAIDPEARSSMWDDLQRGRPTEIDELQGAILRLADRGHAGAADKACHGTGSQGRAGKSWIARPDTGSDQCRPSISVIFCQIFRDRLEARVSMSLTPSTTTLSLTDWANSAAILPVIDSISEQ